MPTVDIPNQGQIQGIDVSIAPFGDCPSSQVGAYIGIPFAQPPVGSLRWKRPQKPAPSWDGTRQSQWQKDPIQNLDMTRFTEKLRQDEDLLRDDETRMSEDCLYLNVWVPPQGKGTTDELPVLAWIYGGAFLAGTTSLPVYDGARLASVTGCIIVSITYRVGPFGFFASRELSQEDDAGGAGNYGLWDIVAGLEWIQQNIHAFGGDAKRVTAFGESAGAIALHSLMLSDAIPTNLFSRVILLSGTALSVLPRTLPSSQATFDTLSESLGAEPDALGDERLAILRSASAKRIHEAFEVLPGVRPRSEYVIDESKGRPKNRMEHDQSTLNFQASCMCGPAWDGVMVAKDFLQRATRGYPLDGFRNGNKGVMIGHTGDEGTVFTIGMSNKHGLERGLSLYRSELRRQVYNLYNVDNVETDQQAQRTAAAFLGDYVFNAPVNALTKALMTYKSDTPTYRYVWAHRPSQSLILSITPSTFAAKHMGSNGAHHSCELPFLFGFEGDDGGFTSNEATLSTTFMKHVGTFAAGGQPWNPVEKSSPAGESDEMPNIPTMAYGDFPFVGSPQTSTPLQQATAKLINLHDMQIWNDLNDAQKRHIFWTENSHNRLIDHFYGDTRITWLP